MKTKPNDGCNFVITIDEVYALLSSSVMEMIVVSGVPMVTPVGTDVILAVKFSSPSLSWSSSMFTWKHTLSSFG